MSLCVNARTKTNKRALNECSKKNKTVSESLDDACVVWAEIRKECA